jgi:hypothetical protein
MRPQGDQPGHETLRLDSSETAGFQQVTLDLNRDLSYVSADRCVSIRIEGGVSQVVRVSSLFVPRHRALEARGDRPRAMARAHVRSSRCARESGAHADGFTKFAITKAIPPRIATIGSAGTLRCRRGQNLIEPIVGLAKVGKLPLTAHPWSAPVTELADVRDLGSRARKGVPVRLGPGAPSSH